LWHSLFEFVLDILFGKYPRFGAKHIRQLIPTHADLITDRHQMICEEEVIFHQKLKRHHEPINVVKNECSSCSVCILRSDKMYWLISPMPERIEMMGSVVSIVETDTVALRSRLAVCKHMAIDALP
jgi:hypothetical protein